MFVTLEVFIFFKFTLFKGIPTNDYYGKTIANQEYEMNGLLPDEYHGNIIFNVPNANYIKLAPNTPFAGHLIAPNADVEKEETQYRKYVATLEYVLSKCPSNNTSNPITNILKNPLTYRSFGLIILVIVISYLGIKVYRDNKKGNSI